MRDDTKSFWKNTFRIALESSVTNYTITSIIHMISMFQIPLPKINHLLQITFLYHNVFF